jgi:carboxylesterase
VESKRRLTDPFYYVGNSMGVLLIHGFTGSPSEMRFLGERLAGEGWTVLGVCLSGHGSTPEELANTSWEDWVRDAENGVKQLRQSCNRVVGIGLSMGGLIALHMASQGMLDGMITMNAPILLQDWGARLVSQAQERFAYDRVPLACIESVNQAIKQVSQEIEKITQPALLMQSRLDKTVNPESVIHIKERMTRTSPEVIIFEKSGHILPLGLEREEVAVRAAGFIRKLEESNCGPWGCV